MDRIKTNDERNAEMSAKAAQTTAFGSDSGINARYPYGLPPELSRQANYSAKHLSDARTALHCLARETEMQQARIEGLETLVAHHSDRQSKAEAQRDDVREELRLVKLERDALAEKLQARLHNEDKLRDRTNYLLSDNSLMRGEITQLNHLLSAARKQLEAAEADSDQLPRTLAQAAAFRRMASKMQKRVAEPVLHMDTSGVEQTFDVILELAFPPDYLNGAQLQPEPKTATEMEADVAVDRIITGAMSLFEMASRIRNEDRGITLVRIEHRDGRSIELADMTIGSAVGTLVTHSYEPPAGMERATRATHAVDFEPGRVISEGEVHRMVDGEIGVAVDIDREVSRWEAEGGAVAAEMDESYGQDIGVRVEPVEVQQREHGVLMFFPGYRLAEIVSDLPADFRPTSGTGKPRG